MKHLKNNQSNELVFVHKGADLTSAFYVRFRQLGSTVNRDLSVTNQVTDCFTTTFTVPLLENELQNGNYIIELISQDKLTIYDSSSAIVEGHDDEDNRAYIIVEE